MLSARMKYAIIEGTEPDMKYAVLDIEGEPLEFETIEDAKNYGWRTLKLDEFTVMKFTPKPPNVFEY
ncbi:hypothetical protein GCM10027592_29290 [Spirosoma flavus]